MLKVSDAFNSAFAAPDRELRARVTIGKTVYDSDDLTSINYDSGAMTGEQFSIGSTYMNSAKIIFSHLVEGLKQLDEVLVEFGVLKPDGTVEYVKMGTFIVDDKIQMDRNNNTTTIECMDRMTMLGGTYVSKLTYPARIKDVAIEIANMAGVKANETSFARLSENKINQPTGYTYRDAIGLIAQFQMGFALFDRDGLLDIRTLQDNSFKIDPNQYFLKGLVKNETFFKLNGISCTVVTTSKDENGNETSKTAVLQSGSSSGAQIKLANNVMTQDVLDRMYEALKFTNYYPFSLNWNGNPAVEAGDWLTVEDLQGNEFKVPNMSYTLTYNGGLTATSKADTSVSSPATYSYGGTISNIVNEIGGRESAEGNHIYEGTEDQEPTLSKEGDLWYKHVGPDTEERIYKDGKWEFLTSTKTANDAADAADKASKEAEEAKNQANKAVDGANDAVAKAGFANDTADQAKSDAATAGQQAKDALTSAGTAITDAKKALTNSSSAMADSAQARKDSATAIKDAADSLTSAKDAISKVGTLTTSVTSQFTTVDNELKSKVNQTDYDKLKGTVTSQQTEINQNASGIKLKADKSYADTINNSVVKNTSSIGLLNNQIALTVSKAELNNTLSSYATQTWTQSQIKLTSDQINLSVSNVDSKINNLTTGGTNLIPNSGDFQKTHHWWWTDTLEVVTHNFYRNGKRNMLKLSTASTTGEATLSSDWFDVTAGSKYVLQFHAFAPATVKSMDVRLMYRKYGSSNVNHGWDGIIAVALAVPLSASKDSVYYYSVTPPAGADEMYLRVDNNGSTDGASHGIYFGEFKMAKETKPSPWAPAPEDLVTNIKYAELTVKVDGITATVANKADKTQITQLANQINLKADTTALNALKGTVDKQGSEITLNTNSIKLKADQSSVDTLKGTVDKQGSAIDVNTKAIALKASQSTVDTLTGRVSTAEGKITVQADQIAQTVSKTELTSKLDGYATQTWSEGKISAAKNEITASVETVKQTVDNWQVGGRNYLLNSKSFIITPPGTANWDWRINISNDFWSNPDRLKPNNIRVSFTLTAQKALTADFNSNLYFSAPPWWSKPISYPAGTTAPKKYELVFNITDPAFKTDNCFIRFQAKDTSANPFILENAKLEIGTTFTDWTPAPEDQATVDWTKGQLSVTNDKVSASVQKLHDAVTGEISTATTDMATKSWTQGKLDLTDSSLTSQISSVKNGLDTKYTRLEQNLSGVQVTANNAVTQGQLTLLSNQFTSTIAAVASGNLVADSGWTGAVAKTHTYYSGPNTLYGLGNATTRENYAMSPRFSLKPNTTYTLSIIGFAGSNVVSADVFVLARPKGSTKDYEHVYNLLPGKRFSPDAAERATSSFTTLNDGEAYIRIDNNGTNNGVAGTVYFTEVQLEEGSIATPYKLSVSAAQSQITQLQNDINLRVKAGDVVNQINISPEGILIDGKKVHITGQTTIDNAVIKDAMIANVTADKITAGTLNAANVNVINLNANNITTGTIKGANLSLNLNTGEVLFQKGSIKSSDGTFAVDIDNRTITSTDDSHNGIVLKHGELHFYKEINAGSGSAEFGRMDVAYLNGGGLNITGYNGLTLGTEFTGLYEAHLALVSPKYNLGKSSAALVGDVIYLQSSLGKAEIIISGKTDISGSTSVIGDFDVLGKKNAIHLTNDGIRETPAYETAESYLGDISEGVTDESGRALIHIDDLFNQIINTDYDYQVFVSSYSNATIWVEERNATSFEVHSNIPNAKFAWEIKAKRRGYETDRLVKSEMKYEQLNKFHEKKVSA